MDILADAYSRVKYGLSDVAIIGHAPVDSMQII